MRRKHNQTALTVASLLLGMQAAFGVVSALVLFASGRRLRRWTLATEAARHRMVMGVIVLAIAAVVVTIAVGVISDGGWARVAAYVFEGLTVVGAMFRAGIHPVASILSVALAMIVVVLIAGAGEGTSAAPQAPGEPGTPAGVT